MKTRSRSVYPFVACLACVSSLATLVSAAEINSGVLAPNMDRWMYPFNTANPLGTEADARIFAPFADPTQAGFDDRDGELLLGFDTSAIITPGQGVGAYRVISATATTVVSPQSAFLYDPTPDAWDTYSNTTDPSPVADSDPGRSIDIFLPGYRNGWTQATFMENSRFSGAAIDPPNPFPYPARQIRNVFPAQYTPAGSGVIQDVSNNVDEQFDPRPIAVGSTSVTIGESVPVGTTFTYNFDMTNPDTRKYLRECLNAGKVTFLVTSLAEARRQNAQTVRFYCKDAGEPNTAPTFNIRVCVGDPADWDCSGDVSVNDLFKFLSEWFGQSADFDENGAVSVNDLFAFLAAWFAAV